MNRQQKFKELNPDYWREWDKQNPTKRAEYSKKRDAKLRQEDPLYYLKRIFNERKRTAKLLGLPFDIILEDIKNIPTECPVLGIPLFNNGKNNPNAPSLDRFIPEKGYVKGNVAWISKRANLMKTNATIQEVELLLKWMKEHEL